MKRKTLAVVLLLSLSMLLNYDALAVMAADAPEYKEYNQDTDFTQNKPQVTVTATIESEFTVTIPQTLTMAPKDGAYECTYTIGVDANIASYEKVSVVPNSTITMSQEGKGDVTLDVTQMTTEFESGNANATGTIKVADDNELTAGHWEGTLTFTIELKEDNGTS